LTISCYFLNEIKKANKTIEVKIKDKKMKNVTINKDLLLSKKTI